VEILEVRVGFQEGILHSIFGVFMISRDVPCETENLAFITIDKFFKCRGVSSLCGCDEKVFVIASDGGRYTMWVWRVQSV